MSRALATPRGGNLRGALGLLAGFALAACAGRDGGGQKTASPVVDASSLEAGAPEAGGTAADASLEPEAAARPTDAGIPPDATPPEPDPLDAPSRCTSGVFRASTEQEGPDMGPGNACIQCHIDANAASGEGDAPLFAFAGTVFPTGHEPDGCIASGALGAVVEVTDATGAVHLAEVNASGNFFLEDPITPPFRALVRRGDQTRKMLERQTSGDCNSCHTETGAFDAPGRITLP